MPFTEKRADEKEKGQYGIYNKDKTKYIFWNFQQNSPKNIDILINTLFILTYHLNTK